MQPDICSVVQVHSSLPCMRQHGSASTVHTAMRGQERSVKSAASHGILLAPSCWMRNSMTAQRAPSQRCANDRTSSQQCCYKHTGSACIKGQEHAARCLQGCLACLPACLPMDCRSSSNTKIPQVAMQGVIDLEDHGATLHMASSRQLGDNDYILDCGCRHDRFLASIPLSAFCNCIAMAQSICVAHAGKRPTWRLEPSA